MSTTQDLMELPAQYDPGQTERAIYQRWVEAGIFSADEKRSRRNGGDRDPFVIVMPPPNVTAVLHMGHGLNNTVQDVLVRWRRMVGDETLWVPGTDHAGIATQNIVEKQLAAEGKSKADLGREAFVQRTIAFVEETGGEILRQLRAIGASADWNRTATRFSGASRGVRERRAVHERGLIYRDTRIHLCPRCLTRSATRRPSTAMTPQPLSILYTTPIRRLWPLRRRDGTSSATALAVHPGDEMFSASSDATS